MPPKPAIVVLIAAISSPISLSVSKLVEAPALIVFTTPVSVVSRASSSPSVSPAPVAVPVRPETAVPIAVP